MAESGALAGGPLGDLRAWDLELRARADRRILVAALAVALVADVVWRSGLGTFSGALLVFMVAGALAVSGRVTNPQAIGLLTGALLLGMWLALRASPWLLGPDLAAVAGLLTLAASFAQRGDRGLLDMTIPGALARGVHAGAHGVAALPFAAAALRQAPMATDRLRIRWREVLWGVLVAAPVVATLVALLASADAVFASLFRVDLRLEQALDHLVALAVGFLAMCGLLRAASAVPLPGLPPLRPRLGPVEATIVLGSVCATFGMFAAAQLVALSEGGRRVIETSGLTYAEYARSGFFQLSAVAAITLIVVLSLRALTDVSVPKARRRFVPLSVLALALTTAVVFVAVRRMNLYEAAYGLTMLRLYVKLFSLWIGGVMVLVALWLLGIGRSRHWVPSASVALGLVGLLLLNVFNPEAIVVRRNVAHAVRTGRFDPVYATSLSPDAVPALVALLPRLDPPDRRATIERLCTNAIDDGGNGWASWNGSRRAAVAAKSGLCSTGVVAEKGAASPRR